MLYSSIEMPGRAYTPETLPTETLNEILQGCRYSEDYLANKHGDTFMLWGRAIAAPGVHDQLLCDQLEKECKNLRRKITMNVNKMYKTRAELDRRFLQELRAPRIRN
jgi:hypothetical protein